MASTQSSVVLAAVLTLLLPSIALGTQHIVGDDAGWTTNFNYTEWAAGKVFRVGDSLVFKYTPGAHNVFKVDGAAFQSCTKPADNLASLTTGNDVVPLTSPGKKWYICGVGQHCASLNMKLAINIVEDNKKIDVEAPAAPPTSSAVSVKPLSVAAAATALATALIAAVA